MKYLIKLLILLSPVFVALNQSYAQNPIIRDQFTADPAARVFNGRVYVYPSHDILAKDGKGRPGWFCMEDYHVFSSENLTDWTDHGVIVSQNQVTPTLRGVGTTSSSQKIQIDRYSAISGEGAAVEFIDTSDTFQGWKTVMNKPNAWIKYNAVDFGTKKAKTIQVKVHSEKGGILRISINDAIGPVLSQVRVPENTEWQVIETKLKQYQPGFQNLVVESLSDNKVEIDWISFR